MAFSCQYMILCEAAQELTAGKVNILGTYDRIFAKRLPAVHPNLTVVAMIHSDSEGDLGTHQVTMRILRPNGDVIGEHVSNPKIVPQGGTWLTSHRIIYNLQGLPFHDAGKHRVELLVDDVKVAEHRFTVALKLEDKPKKRGG